MGKESQIDALNLSPLAQRKIQELVALLADEGFGAEGLRGTPPLPRSKRSAIRRDVRWRGHWTSISHNATPSTFNKNRSVRLAVHKATLPTRRKNVGYRRAMAK